MKDASHVSGLFTDLIFGPCAAQGSTEGKQTIFGFPDVKRKVEKIPPYLS